VLHAAPISNVLLKPDKNKAYFTWEACTFMTVSRWILLRMINVSQKPCGESQNTQAVIRTFFLPFSQFSTDVF
jgi:hypothetical protein